MSEIINTYLLSDPETCIAMDRDEFYKEQIGVFKKTGKPTRANDIVDIFIFNSKKELLIQKRSYKKKHNPGLLDKSIGGHILFGDTPDYTVMVETVQELLTPSIVLKNSNDFYKTLKLLKDYTTTISIVKHSHSKIYHMEKIINGEKIIIANKIHVYFGIYDGSTKPVDREAQGILYYSLPELLKEMKHSPQIFTYDLHLLLKELLPEIKDFLKVFTKK